MDQNAAVRAQPSAKDKVPEEGRRGDHELVFINAPFYAIIAPSSRATAKTDQLDAPVRPTAAFVVVGRVAAKRHSLSAGARRGIEVK